MWVTALQSFSRINVSDLERLWTACGPAVPLKLDRQPDWITPPSGQLKLNFDGSSNTEMNVAGYGGVIRNSNSKEVFSFLVP